MDKKRLGLIAEISIMSAFSLILGFISFKGLWGYGGSVSLEMLPIFIMGFRRGLAAGLITGLCSGLLQLLVNPIAGIQPVSLLLDYPLAFMLAGFSGLFQVDRTQSAKKRNIFIIAGAVLGTFLRFLSHFVSGAVFFAMYAPKGMNPYVYSAIYNASYLIPALLITGAVTILLANAAPRLFFTEHTRNNKAA